ncbi:MAG TPA: type II toxin-antitoxin system VapC family toxin [Thermoanaerobaculia bacterium]|nr:type II toxin-antitoxin system VapC family toxin [Thermoanaerobaculia bacterium]
MRRVLVDTNVLISFVSDRDELQQKRAARLFAVAAAGEMELILHQAVITEFVFVLSNLYGIEIREVAAVLGELLDLPGTSAVYEISWPLVLDLWPGEIPGFADAILATVALQGRYDAVATFDSKLARALRRRGVASDW